MEKKENYTVKILQPTVIGPTEKHHTIILNGSALTSFEVFWFLMNTHLRDHYSNRVMLFENNCDSEIVFSVFSLNSPARFQPVFSSFRHQLWWNQLSLN